jgi:16S rRNA processing protein RimM
LSIKSLPEGKELLRVGRVARAHGLKGDLEIRLDWADSRALLEAESVLLALPGGKSELRALSTARQTHKGVLLRVEGVVDRTAADEWVGATVSVLRSELPPLAEGEYYLCDLQGLQVTGPEGVLGRVVEVQMYPSVDALVIETPGGDRFEQPLLPHWLGKVDVAGGKVILSSLDGLLELPRENERAQRGQG